MSTTLITIIVVGVVLSSAFIMRWQRHSVIVRICPSEIRFLETVEERYRVHARGLNAFLKYWRTWITFIIYALALGVPCVLGSGALMTTGAIRLGPWSVTGVKLGAILCAVIPLFLIPLMFARYRKWMRVYLREYVNDHGIPICKNCGYDLRGQVNPRCPECGAAMREKGSAGERGEGVNGVGRELDSVNGEEVIR